MGEHIDSLAFDLKKKYRNNLYKESSSIGVILFITRHITYDDQTTGETGETLL